MNLLKIIQKLQLEAKLYNAELQDATQTEKWEKTRDRLHRAREVLEAQVVQYFFPFLSSPSNILMQIKIYLYVLFLFGSILWYHILKLVIWMPLSSISNRERFAPRLHWESFRGNSDLWDHHQGQEKLCRVF